MWKSRCSRFFVFFFIYYQLAFRYLLLSIRSFKARFKVLKFRILNISLFNFLSYNSRIVFVNVHLSVIANKIYLLYCISNTFNTTNIRRLVIPGLLKEIGYYFQETEILAYFFESTR